MSEKSTILCLMGPTASGKTALAVELVERMPCEIISVDSAMVYRGMDIGTAKPTADILAKAPHRLIDILDPIESYSAGQFRRDALRAIDEIIARGKMPLLVGGTMMYFRVLQQGIAKLPKADVALRKALLARGEQEGWNVLHGELAEIDAQAAAKIEPQDSQRIQRALEVFLLTGQTISTIQGDTTDSRLTHHMINIGLMPSDRVRLHAKIAERFQTMLDQGFIAEAEGLYKRGDLNEELPAIRSVGYRQAWDYFSGKLTRDEMCEKAITATRQLAKRQMTWLRSWPELTMLDSESAELADQAISVVKTKV